MLAPAGPPRVRPRWHFAASKPGTLPARGGRIFRPRAPPPPPSSARPGQAGHTWARDRALPGRGPGLGRGARAPGRLRRVAGPGPDGGGCGGRGWGGRVGPGHGGFTFSLLQSARPSPTQPHRRSPQPFPAPRTDPARRPPLLRRRSRRPHVTGAEGGAAPGAAEYSRFAPPRHVTVTARPLVPSRTLELPDRTPHYVSVLRFFSSFIL